ncbi:MAG: AAA domain-containing protein [Parabacteroides sp.]
MKKQSVTYRDPSNPLQQKALWLRMEYEYEKEMFKQQTEVMGIGRLIKRGQCWYPVRLGRNYYNSLNQLVIEIERTEDLDIEHLFEFGRPVCLFTQDGSSRLHYLNFTATVNYVDGDRMVLVLPSTQALASLSMTEGRIGVQLYFDETSYRLMFEALQQVIQARDNRLAELRDTFHGSRQATWFRFGFTRFPWLNSTQEEAVNRVMLAKDVAIVHGPPGTGKTTTLVEAIYETLHRESQVMVSAQSNMAVDWISEKLVDRGVPVLRIGNPTRVNDKMLSFTYERRFEGHPDYPQLWSIRKAIRELYAHARNGMEREKFHQKISALKDRATELEIRINEALFAEARVIACTLVGSAHRVLTGRKFGTLFIDEAAQALEPACWIAIRKADRVILAGDHCQLPPTIKCPEAARGGLDETLMQVIVRNRPETVSLLGIQYRMNEAIMRFSSDWFYQGALRSAPDVKYRSILDFDTPIEWIDTQADEGGEEFVGDNFGRINKAEAARSIEQLTRYIQKIGKERFLEERMDVGVISPYKAQVQYLRQLIKRDPFFKPYRPFISINTVDGFQGQERDIILISLVRANETGQIGFLKDLRRMNVAMTRARMKLIILGDVSTLTHHPFYRKLYDYIHALQEDPSA